MRFEELDHGTVLLIHLDDGKVVQVEGMGWDEVTLDYGVIGRMELNAIRKHQMGERETLRNRKRFTQPTIRRGMTASQFSKAIKEAFDESISAEVSGINRMFYGSPPDSV